MTFVLTKVDVGLPKAGAIEVAMSNQTTITPTVCEPDNNQALWTSGLGDCSGIATFDLETGKRTLTHIAGSDTTTDPGFFRALARQLDPEHETAFIVVQGENTGEFLIGRFKNNCLDKIQEAMMAEYPTLAFYVPNCIIFSTSTSDGSLIKNSFVLMANGQYGIAQAS